MRNAGRTCRRHNESLKLLCKAQKTARLAVSEMRTPFDRVSIPNNSQPRVFSAPSQSISMIVWCRRQVLSRRFRIGAVNASISADQCFFEQFIFPLVFSIQFFKFGFRSKQAVDCVHVFGNSFSRIGDDTITAFSISFGSANNGIVLR